MPIKDGESLGFVYGCASSDNRRADAFGDHARADANAHCAHDLRGVEPQHRAHQCGAHREHRGELCPYRPPRL